MCIPLVTASLADSRVARLQFRLTLLRNSPDPVEICSGNERCRRSTFVLCIHKSPQHSPDQRSCHKQDPRSLGWPYRDVLHHQIRDLFSQLISFRFSPQTHTVTATSIQLRFLLVLKRRRVGSSCSIFVPSIRPQMCPSSSPVSSHF